MWAKFSCFLAREERSVSEPSATSPASALLGELSRHSSIPGCRDRASYRAGSRLSSRGPGTQTCTPGSGVRARSPSRPSARSGRCRGAGAEARRGVSPTAFRPTSFVGAGNGIRTRDIQLGRLTLYQLSYSRVPVRSLRVSGGGRRIRTFEGVSRQIYSLLPLAARASLLESLGEFKLLPVRCLRGLSSITPGAIRVFP